VIQIHFLPQAPLLLVPAPPVLHNPVSVLAKDPIRSFGIFFSTPLSQTSTSLPSLHPSKPGIPRTRGRCPRRTSTTDARTVASREEPHPRRGRKTPLSLCRDGGVGGVFVRGTRRVAGIPTSVIRGRRGHGGASVSVCHARRVPHRRNPRCCARVPFPTTTRIHTHRVCVPFWNLDSSIHTFPCLPYNASRATRREWPWMIGTV
jgi:hypothetical protein